MYVAYGEIIRIDILGNTCGLTNHFSHMRKAVILWEVTERRPGARMIRFLVRRLLELVPTVLVIVVASFALVRLAPGSPFSSEKEIPG